MDGTTWPEVAGTLAWVGALVAAVAALNYVALRALCPEDVPRCVRGRIRWWTAHNSTVLLVSALISAVGLVGLVTA